MKSPYQNAEPRSFWRKGATDRHPLLPGDIYRKKFEISLDDRIATAGSCFAQHIAKRLRYHGYQVIDEEPPPPGLTGQAAQHYGFELYSARFGNIYTVRQLLQLYKEAHGEFTPADAIWKKNSELQKGAIERQLPASAGRISTGLQDRRNRRTPHHHPA